MVEKFEQPIICVKYCVAKFSQKLFIVRSLVCEVSTSRDVIKSVSAADEIGIEGGCFCVKAKIAPKNLKHFQNILCKVLLHHRLRRSTTQLKIWDKFNIETVPKNRNTFFGLSDIFLVQNTSAENTNLRLIHITAFSACVCGRLLHCSAEIEKFLSLRWRSPLHNPQTAAASVNQPLRGRINVHLTSCLVCFDSTALFMLIDWTTVLLVWSNPNKSNRRSAVQWYYGECYLTLDNSFISTLKAKVKAENAQCEKYSLVKMKHMFLQGLEVQDCNVEL